MKKLWEKFKKAADALITGDDNWNLPAAGVNGNADWFADLMKPERQRDPDYLRRTYALDIDNYHVVKQVPTLTRDAVIIVTDESYKNLSQSRLCVVVRLFDDEIGRELVAFRASNAHCAHDGISNLLAWHWAERTAPTFEAKNRLRHAFTHGLLRGPVPDPDWLGLDLDWPNGGHVVARPWEKAPERVVFEGPFKTPITLNFNTNHPAGSHSIGRRGPVLPGGLSGALTPLPPEYQGMFQKIHLPQEEE